jgi:competence protein ComFC
MMILQDIPCIFDDLIQLLFDCNCICCGDGMQPDERGPVCRACYHALYEPHGSGCILCGHPVAFDKQCPSCRHLGTIHYDNLSFIHYYTGFFRDVLLKWKAGGYFRLSYIFSELLIKNGLVNPGTPVVIVPCSTADSFVRAGANLSSISSILSGNGIPQIKGVYKKRFSPYFKQKKLTVRQRIDGIGNRFYLPSRNQNRYSGRVILLDDVYTTGATVNIGAKLLKEAGFSHVTVITLFRGILDSHHQ